MAMGIAYALVFSLFGLPALLVLEEKALYWIKERFRFGIDREFSLHEDSEVCIADGDKRGVKR
jgi:hypothetical protein